MTEARSTSVDGADPLQDDPRVEHYFGSAWPAVLAFHDLLVAEGELRGLIGPREFAAAVGASPAELGRGRSVPAGAADGSSTSAAGLGCQASSLRRWCLMQKSFCSSRWNDGPTG